MTNNFIQLNRRSLQGVLTLISLTSTILISPIAIAGKWVRVKTDASNNAYHIDVSTIEGRGRWHYFWSNVIYGQPNTNIVPGQQVYNTTYYIAVDCQNQIEWSAIASLGYDRILLNCQANNWRLR
jgi:hypothetical protein